MNAKPGYIFKGNGVPVVFLHCSMSSKEQWFKILGELKDEFAVLAIDLHGYGQSPFPDEKEGFSLDDEIELMESAIAETIGKDAEFHLVGHSYGGAVAMRYSSLEKRKNVSLSVYEPMLNHVYREIDKEMYDASRDFIGEIEGDVARGEPDSGCMKFIDYFSGEGTFESLPEEIRNIFRKCINKMPLDYRATVDQELSIDKYRKIDIPVCLMSGMKSPELTTRISDVLSEIIPNVEFHRIDGNHMAPIEKSDLVNKVIKSFIKKCNS